MALTVVALAGLPEIAAGDDLARLIAGAAQTSAPGGSLVEGDVVVVAHKAISKAEGRVRTLTDVSPGERARALAGPDGKDARIVQVVLDESRAVLRAQRGVLVCETHHGYVCANAGVDASNAPGEGRVIMLPRDPDGSARALRDDLRGACGVAPAVVVSDSFGRAWRHGQCDVAIGCAGLEPLEDWCGRRDGAGRELRATWIAVADEAAAAADLARAKDSREPVVVVRGLQRHVIAADGPGAAALRRPEAEDLFR